MSHMGIEEELKEGESPENFVGKSPSSSPVASDDDNFLRRSLPQDDQSAPSIAGSVVAPPVANEGRKKAKPSATGMPLL